MTGARPQESAQRLELYQAGLTDAAIAEATGANRAAVRKWRNMRGLPAHEASFAAAGHLCRADCAKRALLYQLGWGDDRMAKELGVRVNTIRLWRRRAGLAANFAAHVRQRDNPRPKLSDIYNRVRRAIGRALPRDIADDATSDLMLAVLDGTIPLPEIEAHSRKYGNRVLDQYASKFGPRSIDETLPGMEDLRMVDLIRDERSSDWLEEMGATVW